METILSLLERYTAEHAAMPILFDEAHSKGISYEPMLWSRSVKA